MPDEEGFDSPEQDAPAVDDSGQGEATPQDTQEYTPDWNWEEYADKRIPVQVDGQTQYVTLKDAREGHMRHSDYTRKTQAVAQREQELEYADAVLQSLRLNPEDTIAYLQREWLAEQAEAQAAGQAGEDFDPDIPLSPEEEKIQELWTWREQVEQQQAEKAVHDEIAQLEQRFGSDYDWNAVLEHAINTNAINVTAAFKDLHFDTAWAEAQAVRDARAAKERADAEAREQARSGAAAAGVVHHGGSTSSGSVSSGPSDGLMSVREAWAAARQS